MSAPWKTYHERKADEAYDAFAGPCFNVAKSKYRECRTADDLHKLSRYCWAEANYASRTINKNGYDNVTRWGCATYDKWDALYSQARTLAIEFYKKAKRIEAGEPAEVVMPHLAKSEAVS